MTTTAPALDPAAEDTWLIDHAARARLQEVDGRPRTARRSVFVLELLVVIACIPQLGIVSLLTFPLVVLAFVVADRLMGRVKRPEVVYAAAWSVAQLMIGVTAVATGGPDSPSLMWLGIPIATGVGRFTSRGLVAGVALTLAILVAATVGADPGRELALQSELSGRPVAVVVGDLDHFKAVNDLQGHQAGDAVLREIAYRWRTTLRAYDLAYRLGGEEFVVLLPGAGAAEATDLAEQLRAAVGGFDLDTYFARADAALYAAKDRGRDRVVLSA